MTFRNFIKGLQPMLVIVALLSSYTFCAEYVPIPKNFSYSLNPISGFSSAWYLDASRGVLHDNGKDRPYCMYNDLIRVPAAYSDRLDEYFCVGITIRHLRDVLFSRHHGVCEGMVCQYDQTIPGNGATLTTDLVNECPDILISVVNNGKVELVEGIYLNNGDRKQDYFRDGIPAEIYLDISEPLVDICASQRYRNQLKYWLNYAIIPGDKKDERPVSDDWWDGT